MDYINKYEYDHVVMVAMENALLDSWENIVDVEFYKTNEYRNKAGKLDGHFVLMFKDEQKYNLQIKRSPKHSKSFSIRGDTLRNYISGDFDIDMLMVGLAYQKSMYLFYWDNFIEYAIENHTYWKSTHGDYYVIPLIELIDNLHHKELPYTEKDYNNLQAYWESK